MACNGLENDQLLVKIELKRYSQNTKILLNLNIIQDKLNMVNRSNI